MDIDLHSTIDAAVWASEFERLKNECAWSLDYIDEGLMISWFSNAMYTQEMHDRKEIESMRQQIGGFPNLDDMRQAMVDTANENERLRQQVKDCEETINTYVDLLNERDTELTVERAISDKLEKSLQATLDLDRYSHDAWYFEAQFDSGRATLAELSALRKIEK